MSRETLYSRHEWVKLCTLVEIQDSESHTLGGGMHLYVEFTRECAFVPPLPPPLRARGNFETQDGQNKLTIGSCVSVRSSRYEARGKFGEHERWNLFFSRDLFADVMSVHNRNMKHARVIEFD